MAGDNSLSFKECIHEANSPTRKEVQYTHTGSFPRYTQYIRCPPCLLKATELQSVPIESCSIVSVSLTCWTRLYTQHRIDVCVFSSHLSGILGHLVRTNGMILQMSKDPLDYW